MTGLRLMTDSDLPCVMDIIRGAQSFLAEQGIDQWQNGYPNLETMRADIEKEQGYVYRLRGQTVGILTIAFGGEPSYQRIYEGSWSTGTPYACIHRMAIGADCRGGGVADRMLLAAESLIPKKGVQNIRVDTHRQNIRMQRMLSRNGFARCGVIYLMDGMEASSERIAFEKAIGKTE